MTSPPHIANLLSQPAVTGVAFHSGVPHLRYRNDGTRRRLKHAWSVTWLSNGGYHGDKIPIPGIRTGLSEIPVRRSQFYVCPQFGQRIRRRIRATRHRVTLPHGPGRHNLHACSFAASGCLYARRQQTDPQTVVAAVFLAPYYSERQSPDQPALPKIARPFSGLGAKRIQTSGAA